MIDIIYNNKNIKEFLDIYPTNVWNDVIPKVIEIGILNLKNSFGKLKFNKSEFDNILNVLYKSLPPSNYENKNMNNLIKYKYENNLLKQNNNNKINNKSISKLTQQNNNNKVMKNNNNNNKNLNNNNLKKNIKKNNKDLPFDFQFERIHKNNSFQNTMINNKKKSNYSNSINLYKKRPNEINIEDINYDNFNPNSYYYSSNYPIDNEQFNYNNQNNQYLNNNSNYANTNSYF